MVSMSPELAAGIIIDIRSAPVPVSDPVSRFGLAVRR